MLTLYFLFLAARRHISVAVFVAGYGILTTPFFFRNVVTVIK